MHTYCTRLVHMAARCPMCCTQQHLCHLLLGAGSKPGEQAVCGVCFTELPSSSCVHNSCGHGFCKDCWTQYLGIQVSEVKVPLLHCMAFKCNMLLQPDVLQQLLKVRQAYC